MRAAAEAPRSLVVRSLDKWLYKITYFKCQKHGVSLAAIETVFDGPVAVFPDPVHSRTEQRVKAIGYTREGRAILIVFTLRNRDASTLIRAVSARYVRAMEIEHYEKEAAGAQER